MPLRSLLLVAAALVAGGCAPALTAASSTPAGQAAIERAVQSALVRAGLASPTASPLPVAEAEAPTLHAGPMLADVTQRGAAVWVLTAPGAEVVVDAFGPDSLSAGGTMLAASGRTTSGPDGTATVRLFEIGRAHV